MATSERMSPEPEAADSAPSPSDLGQHAELAGIVDELPAHQKQTLVRVLAVSHTEATWSSLAPPNAYAKYAQTFRGAADRILTIAENEQQIRADAKSRILHRPPVRSRRHTGGSDSILRGSQAAPQTGTKQ